MRSFTASWVRFVFGLLVVPVALTACGGDGPFTATAESAVTESPPLTAPEPNAAPTITGSAATSATAGEAYSFTPSAADADRDEITFTIANKPAWASFNAGTGALTGTPVAKDVGQYASVEIAATDGNTVTALSPFTITVAAPADAAAGAGAVTVAWSPPTRNDDGSALTDLSGYRIHYGTQSQNYTDTLSLSNPGLTRFVVESLPSGKYYLAMTAYNAAGAESDYSPEVTVMVN